MGGVVSATPSSLGVSGLGVYVDWDILTNLCVTLHRTLHFPKYDSNTWAFFGGSDGGPGSLELTS